LLRWASSRVLLENSVLPAALRGYKVILPVDAISAITPFDLGGNPPDLFSVAGSDYHVWRNSRQL
jgi:hypothetical protein